MSADRDRMMKSHEDFQRALLELRLVDVETEEEAIRAVRSVAQHHGQELSDIEFELFALEALDANWAEKDPRRLQRLLEELAQTAAQSKDPRV